MKRVNENAYELKLGTTFALKVIAKTDPVPGTWHDPMDLINWICEHPYVQSVELIEIETDAAEMQRVNEELRP